MGQHTAFILGREEETLRDLVASQPVFIDITTPAFGGTEMKIEHSLGRIPKVYVLVKQIFGSFNHGHDDGDTEWDEHFIYLKFSVTNTALTIAVF